MTDGTSQGLFIVVAIVIFGIFVVMAYILFEDTLSPALASMFINATEQASDNLLSNSLVRASDFLYRDLGHLSDIKVGRDSITYKSSGNEYMSAPYIPSNKLEMATDYILTYTIKDLGNSLKTLGGHVNAYTDSGNNIIAKVFVNGEDMGNYHNGFALPESTDKKWDVRIEFTTNNANFKQDTLYASGFGIQPNRQYNSAFLGYPLGAEGWQKVPGYHVEISNILLKYANK